MTKSLSKKSKKVIEKMILELSQGSSLAELTCKYITRCYNLFTNDQNPKSAIEIKSLVKSASKIVRAGEGFL